MPVESDRHWDALCIGIVTIATAALGTVIFVADIYNVSATSAGRPISELTKVGFAGLAIILYLAMTMMSGVAIFFADRYDETKPDAKRRLTFVVYALFVAEVFTLSILLAVNVIMDIVTSQPVPGIMAAEFSL